MDPGSVAAIALSARDGAAHAVECVEAALARIESVESKVRAWCALDADGARRQARLLDEEAKAGRLRGPLHGVPVAIKDVIDVAGFATRAGSPTRAGVPPATTDAVAVAALRAAGAIIMGKAHTTEFAFFTGPPPTHNPYNLRHTPGGSSGGPAAAVASGMVPLALGTQTAGSVSRPAAYCGIGAFKPSTLSMPQAGLVPFAPSFDTIGVFGFRLADAIAGFEAIAPPFLRFGAGIAAREQDLRIAVVEDTLFASADHATVSAMARCVEDLATRGFSIVEHRPSVSMADVARAHRTVIEYEVGHAHPHLRDIGNDAISPELREAVGRGLEIDSAIYVEARRRLDELRTAFWAGLAEEVVLIAPAAPTPAPPGEATGDPSYIIPFTALGGPIASIPVGLAPSGLPIGLMATAAPGLDHVLARRARRLAEVIEMPR